MLTLSEELEKYIVHISMKIDFCCETLCFQASSLFSSCLLKDDSSTSTFKGQSGTATVIYVTSLLGIKRILEKGQDVRSVLTMF